MAPSPSGIKARQGEDPQQQGFSASREPGPKGDARSTSSVFLHHGKSTDGIPE